jgi:RRXRR protein
MQRVPVLSKTGLPLMPTKPSRARRWLNSGKARVVYNDLGIFQIQLTQFAEEETQLIVVGVDSGKLYTGIGVQSAKFTLWTAHLQLPFKTVKDRIEQRGKWRHRNSNFSQRLGLETVRSI